MNDRDRALPPELEADWQEWASTEPSIDERQLRRNLLARIPERRHRTRSRLVLVAAASLLAVLIGLENTRQSRQPVITDGEIVHETGANVILVLREGCEPIYIATEPPNSRVGE
jgi:ferric-dicitrate binding protein FerR (iron transport regulator)